MHCERSSTREYAQSDDLKPNMVERWPAGWWRGNALMRRSHGSMR